MDSLISILYDFFNGIGAFFTSAFNWLLDGIILVLGYTVYYIFSGIIGSIVVFLNSINLAVSAFDFVGEFAGLPPQLLYLMDNTGFTAGLSIICSAYLIRFAMNLIPFVRI